MTERRSVAVLLFPGVELLDFAGPFEVFSAARVSSDSRERLMDVFTVAESLEPIRCNNPLTVLPDYTLEECPAADILVIPGGMGTRSGGRPGRADRVDRRQIRVCRGNHERVHGQLPACEGGALGRAAGHDALGKHRAHAQTSSRS